MERWRNHRLLFFSAKVNPNNEGYLAAIFENCLAGTLAPNVESCDKLVDFLNRVAVERTGNEIKEAIILMRPRRPLIQSIAF